MVIKVTLVTKAKTPVKDTGTKPTKVEKDPFGKQAADGNKTAQAKVQAIPASHIAELETDSKIK